MKNQKKDQSRAGMVDVSQKNVTQRRAIASCTLTMSSTAFQKFLKDGSPKGDVLETAKVAGIMAAKATSQIIPLCHPLELSKVNISFALDHQRQAITTTAQVVCWGRTGVEMEALTAVSVAALTIYDMMKWADKTMVISAIQLLHKSGGKQGTFDRS